MSIWYSCVWSFLGAGYFHTGDLGRVMPDGQYVQITGRIKELIVTSGGEKFPPVVIEHHILEELPILSNAVLIGDRRKYLTVLLTLRAKIADDFSFTVRSLDLRDCDRVRQ